MNASDDLDLAAIERLRRLGGDKFTTEMIRLFIDYGGQKMAEARSALAAGDLKGVEKAVHPIKSSAGNVGAKRLQQLAMEAEQQAREQQTPSLTSLIDQMQAAYETVKPLLAAQQRGVPAADTPGG